MPHRSTQWRWKKHGRPISPNIGRRVKQQRREKRIRELLVQLTKQLLPGFSIYLNLWVRDGIPLDLVAVVAHDVLGFGYRSRRPDRKNLVKVLLRDLPYLSKEKAEALVKDGGEWLAHYKPSDQPISESGRRIKRFGIVEGSPCCISKLFPHISRRMACYWRKHPKYKEVSRDIDTMTPAPRFRSPPSSWPQAPFFL